MAPVNMVEPFARAWSLNLIDNVVYTTSGRGCGQLPAVPGVKPSVVPGSVSAMDVSDLAHPRLTRFYTSGNKYSGPWGRGGVTRGPGGTVITQTADGFYDPAAGDFGETVLKLAPKATRLLDSFTPSNWQFLNAQDLDLGSASSDVFTFQNRTLIAVAGKEGFLYLLDAADLGGRPNHRRPYTNHRSLVTMPQRAAIRVREYGALSPAMRPRTTNASCMCRCGGRLQKMCRSSNRTAALHLTAASWHSRL